MTAIIDYSVIDHAIHTAYTDPGDHAALLAAVPVDDMDALSAVVRNVVVHYRASGHELPAATASDIHLRWLEEMLDRDQERHAAPLAQSRAATSRLQGCCRDHTLLSVAILRQHEVPARSRVGFADYFLPGWHHDHVIPEFWTGERWRRFEPELEASNESLTTPRDLLRGNGFHTAAEVWRALRAGQIDPDRYGVDRSVPVARGAWFIREYVLLEVAHRFGDELLLWDTWGLREGPGHEADDVELIDELAALLIAADDGDLAAEQRLLDLYRADDRLHPGEAVLRIELTDGRLVAQSLRR